MRTAFTLLCIILVYSSNAQITVSKTDKTSVGRIAPMGIFIAELSYTTNASDTTYSFTFTDKKETQTDILKSVSFSNKGNALNSFYSVLKSVFENKKDKDYSVDITLGDTKANISNFRVMGKTSAMFRIGDSFTFLSESQVNKLFGH